MFLSRYKIREKLNVFPHYKNKKHLEPISKIRLEFRARR